MPKFYASVPTYRTELMAQAAVDRIEEYFHVRCPIVPTQLSPESQRILLMIVEEMPSLPKEPVDFTQPSSFQVEIPDGVVGETRLQIESFLVAWGCGWEDGVLAVATGKHRVTMV